MIRSRCLNCCKCSKRSRNNHTLEHLEHYNAYNMHAPVLLKEVVDCLDPHPGDFLIDGTVNGGGHAKALLEKILPGGHLLGIDWDENLLENLKSESWVAKHQSDINLIHGNYADLPEIIERRKLSRADGLVLDLGFSSAQIEESKRGFSFDRDEPLIMTYSGDQIPVAQIIRELSEKELADVIYNFSGERLSRVIAKKIKEASKKKRIISSLELANVIRGAVPKKYEQAGRKDGTSRIDPATRTFQALRIYANRELENLENILKKLPSVIAPQGRVAIITFHSLEDALVKNYFSKMASTGEAELINKKPLTASPDEIKKNPRSRSAKLRAIKIN